MSLIQTLYDIYNSTYNIIGKGGIKEKYYINNFGKKHGKYESYYSNGKIWVECDYIDDKLNGLYKAYHDNGNLKVICKYKNDKIIGQYIEYWYNTIPRIICDYPFSEGILNGIYNEFYENGFLKKICNYENGKIKGKYNEYYDDRCLWIEAEYNNDVILKYHQYLPQ